MCVFTPCFTAVQRTIPLPFSFLTPRICWNETHRPHSYCRSSMSHMRAAEPTPPHTHSRKRRKKKRGGCVSEEKKGEGGCDRREKWCWYKQITEWQEGAKWEIKGGDDRDNKAASERQTEGERWRSRGRWRMSFPLVEADRQTGRRRDRQAANTMGYQLMHQPIPHKRKHTQPFFIHPPVAPLTPSEPRHKAPSLLVLKIIICSVYAEASRSSWTH